ncbi:MAG TPA: HipA domain-containing protein [Myxococcota bacterium]|nr:HipA domain-containing protein [Myxococcota bacterium]
MEREYLVYIDLEGEPVLAGRLFSRVRKGRESASFEYDNTWRNDPRAFGLDPVQLPLGAGTFHAPAQTALFNGFTDGAPDRWGRTLLRRLARRHGVPARTLFEIDFLILVDDETRQGAYRYREASGKEFLAPHGLQRIPPLVDLPRLLGATRRVLDNDETDDDLSLLLAPGSSLGGARPKASVKDTDGSLLIAKFPRRDDELPMCEWEFVAIQLAYRAGISVGQSRLVSAGNARVFINKRFDRNGARRIPFLSALTMLGARDNQQHSYLEIADAIRQNGSHVRADLGQLWRRIVFNIMVANSDDHLRNHGFLWDGEGWTLSPAYDLNPTPLDIKPRVLALAINEDDPTGSIELALSVAEYFDLRKQQAIEIVEQISKAVASWADLAKSTGMSAAQIDRARSAFELSG